MSLLHAYLASPKTKNALARRPGEEGFSLIELVVVIAVLAILSAVAIPAFVGVQANGKASAVKNGLANGVKECVVRSSDNKGTAFGEAQSFVNTSAFQGYTLSAIGTQGCFAALATADSGSGLANFQIQLDPSTGIAYKSCSDGSKPGCSSTEATGTPPSPLVANLAKAW
jgi:prepilin-type N-terminal cleavage/methylation domain-containing protein